MADWLVAVVGAGSALAGSGLTMFGQLRMERRRERSADRHRFVELKLSSYGELLGGFERFRSELGTSVGWAAAYQRQHGDRGVDPSDLVRDDVWEIRRHIDALVDQLG